MITVTIYEHEGEQRFMVHQGPEAVDVTNDYVVHALNVEGLDGVMIEGHHIGKRRARDPERAEGKEL